jgi:hypothetical protein
MRARQGLQMYIVNRLKTAVCGWSILVDLAACLGMNFAIYVIDGIVLPDDISAKLLPVDVF